MNNRCSILAAWLMVPAALAQVGDVTPVHDPVMIHDESSYYVFCSGPGAPIRRSRDLLHWELIGRVFKEHAPAWALGEIPAARNIWAPDIALYRGQYHLYYSTSTLGSQRSVIGLATNRALDPASPDYRWIDHGKVLETFPDKCDYNAIDPNLVLDEDGQPWLVFGSFWSGIKLVQLDPATGKPPQGELKVQALAFRPGNAAIEGAFMVRRDGFYYLFGSIDHCCVGVPSNYKIIVGRSREISGPFVDGAGRRMLEGGGSLVLVGEGRWRGPGHHGMLIGGPDGDWMVNHAYDALNKGVSTMQIRPVAWPEGWPVVGEPLSTTPPAKPAEADAVPGVWLHRVNEEPELCFDLRPGGKVHSLVPGASWSYNGGLLKLSWPSGNAPGGAWVDACVVAAHGRRYVGRNGRGNLIRGRRVPQSQPAE